MKIELQPSYIHIIGQTQEQVQIFWAGQYFNEPSQRRFGF